LRCDLRTVRVAEKQEKGVLIFCNSGYQNLIFVIMRQPVGIFYACMELLIFEVVWVLALVVFLTSGMVKVFIGMKIGNLWFKYSCVV